MRQLFFRSAIVATSLGLATSARAHDLYDELGHLAPHEHDGDDAGSKAGAGEGAEDEAAASRVGGAETHDGFYLRFLVGPGAVRGEAKAAILPNTPRTEVALGGGGGSFDFEIGAAVVEDVIVYAKLGGTNSDKPTLEIGDAELDLDNVSLGLSRIGAGAQYYFSSINLYASASITAVKMQLLDENDEAIEGTQTETGAMVYLGVGKEWWVSDNWGLGVALQIGSGSIPPGKDEDASKMRVMDASLAFSATYN